MSRKIKLSMLAGCLLVLIGGTISKHSVSAGKPKVPLKACRSCIVDDKTAEWSNPSR